MSTKFGGIMKKVKTLAFIMAFAMMFATFSCKSDDGGNSGSSPNVNEVVTLNIEENATGFLKTNGKIKTDDTKWIGYSKGYIENLGETSNIYYTVTASTAITDAKIGIHYGHWSNPVRGIFVHINGTCVNPTSPIKTAFTAKGTPGVVDPNRWIDSGFVEGVSLRKGVNTIALMPAEAATTYTFNGETYTTDQKAMPNIDYLIVTGKGLTAGGTPSETYASIIYSSEPGTSSMGSVAVAKADGNSVSSGGAVTSGTTITLTATANSGYKFDAWWGNVNSNANPCNFTVSDDSKIYAHFIPESFNKATELAGLEGYATVINDEGTAYTITGGFGGGTIEISTLAELVSNRGKISGNEPYIIKIKARISAVEWIDNAEYKRELAKLTKKGKTEAEAKFILKNRSTTFDIGSNKTVIGVQGSDFGFKNINPKIMGTNVIVKNLHFGDVIGDDYFGGKGNDALSIKGGRNVWIDSCEFSSSLEPKEVDGTAINFNDHNFPVDLEGENTTPEQKWKKDFYDGLLDISEMSRFVSVSNSFFHDHWKACLCGGSNDKAETQPMGSLVRLTFYNNYFKDIHARQPLFRFGRAHIYSSYYKGIAGGTQSTGIEVRAESKVYVDNCYFEDIRADRTVGCWNTSSGLGQGVWTVKDCVGQSNSNNAGFEPPYTWTKTTAAQSKTNVTANWP